MIAAPAGAQVNGYRRNQSATAVWPGPGGKLVGYFGSQYAVSFGQGYYVRLYRVPAGEIYTRLYQQYISEGSNGQGASVLTLRFLGGQLDLHGVSNYLASYSGFYNFFNDGEGGDFQEALLNTTGHNGCLLLHGEPGVVGVDWYNWTWTSSECIDGQLFIPT